mgnify:CR=1 FL=1
MPYIILRTDRGGAYVSRQGSTHSYTTRLQYARTFATREEAEANRCPDNEMVLRLEVAVQVAH